MCKEQPRKGVAYCVVVGKVAVKKTFHQEKLKSYSQIERKPIHLRPLMTNGERANWKLGLIILCLNGSSVALIDSTSDQLHRGLRSLQRSGLYGYYIHTVFLFTGKYVSSYVSPSL